MKKKKSDIDLERGISLYSAQAQTTAFPELWTQQQTRSMHLRSLLPIIHLVFPWEALLQWRTDITGSLLPEPPCLLPDPGNSTRMLPILLSYSLSNQIMSFTKHSLVPDNRRWQVGTDSSVHPVTLCGSIRSHY